jgi:hypothetical protein
MFKNEKVHVGCDGICNDCLKEKLQTLADTISQGDMNAFDGSILTLKAPWTGT